MDLSPPASRCLAKANLNFIVSDTISNEIPSQAYSYPQLLSFYCYITVILQTKGYMNVYSIELLLLSSSSQWRRGSVLLMLLVVVMVLDTIKWEYIRTSTRSFMMMYLWGFRHPLYDGLNRAYSSPSWEKNMREKMLTNYADDDKGCSYMSQATTMNGSWRKIEAQKLARKMNKNHYWDLECRYIT